MIFKYLLKSIIRNRSLWGWGVVFMFFWLLLGVFVFSTSVPKQAVAALSYASSYYGTITLFSFSTIAISISYTLYYGSSALAYCFRYTKLTPSGYFLSLLGAASVMATIMSAIMLSATYALFSWKFGVNLYPYQPLASLALSAISGAFMMVLAMALVLVVINYAGVKNITFVGFIPLVMSYIFGFGQLYTTIPEYIEYASPFTAISSLLYASYGGFAIPKVFINPSAGTLNPSILLLSLIAWLLVLAVLDTQLLRRIRPRAIEEARQV
jgi:hypothetical protein